MNGRPVWLASCSLHHNGPVPTGEYNKHQKDHALRILKQLLSGVGDERWTRFFRMNLTFCLHRGLSDREIARLPAWWHAAPAVHIAGGPVEVFWSRGAAPGAISADPCHDPRKTYLSPKIWLPLDCGQCPPCRARAEIERTGKPCAVCVE